MADKHESATRLHCKECGRQASADGEWDTVSDPQLGSLTQCPGCGSTNVEHVVE